MFRVTFASQGDKRTKQLGSATIKDDSIEKAVAAATTILKGQKQAVRQAIVSITIRKVEAEADDPTKVTLELESSK